MIDQRLMEIAVAPLYLSDEDQMVARFVLHEVVALEPGSAILIVQHQCSARCSSQGHAVKTLALRTVCELLGQRKLGGCQYVDDIALSLPKVRKRRSVT